MDHGPPVKGVALAVSLQVSHRISRQQVSRVPGRSSAVAAGIDSVATLPQLLPRCALGGGAQQASPALIRGTRNGPSTFQAGNGWERTHHLLRCCVEMLEGTRAGQTPIPATPVSDFQAWPPVAANDGARLLSCGVWIVPDPPRWPRAGFPGPNLLSPSPRGTPHEHMERGLCASVSPGTG